MRLIFHMLSPFEQCICPINSFFSYNYHMTFKQLLLFFFQDPSVQKVGGGRKKTVSFSSMPSEKKVDATKSVGNLI